MVRWQSAAWLWPAAIVFAGRLSKAIRALRALLLIGQIAKYIVASGPVVMDATARRATPDVAAASDLHDLLADFRTS